MNDLQPHGILFVVSAPSGAGKTSLCEQLLAKDDHLQYSISCTTRPPRKGEQDGVHYHFLSEEAYREKVEEGAFLEHAWVHGNGYGTLRKTVEDILRSGRDVLMDVDVQGAEQLRERVQEDGGALASHYVDIFISPPSEAVLRERLTARGQDSDDVIAVRMKNALSEMQHAGAYQHQLINDDFDRALSNFRLLIEQERTCLR